MTPSAEAKAGDETRLRTVRLGVALFLFADGMLFAGLVGGLIILHSGGSTEGMPSPFLWRWNLVLWGMAGGISLWRATRQMREGENEDRMLVFAQAAFLFLTADMTLRGIFLLRERPELTSVASTELALAGLQVVHLFALTLAIFVCRAVSAPRRRVWIEGVSLGGYFVVGTGLLLAGLFYGLR